MPDPQAIPQNDPRWRAAMLQQLGIDPAELLPLMQQRSTPMPPRQPPRTPFTSPFSPLPEAPRTDARPVLGPPSAEETLFGRAMRGGEDFSRGYFLSDPMAEEAQYAPGMEWLGMLAGAWPGMAAITGPFKKAKSLKAGATKLDEAADAAAAAVRKRKVEAPSFSTFREPILPGTSAMPGQAPITLFPKPAPKTAPAVDTLPHLVRAPIEEVGEGRFMVSGRVPTGPKAEAAPGGQRLLASMADAKLDPDFYHRVAEAVRQYPFLTVAERRRGDKYVIQRATEMIAENQRFSMGVQDPALSARAKDWYPGAHGIGTNIATNRVQTFAPNIIVDPTPNKAVSQIANATDFSPNQTSGVMAALSNSKDWNENVELATRMPTHFRRFQETDEPFRREYLNQLIETTRTKVARDIKLTTTMQDRLDMEFNALQNIEKARAAIGKPWSVLDDEERAFMMRAYDELNHPQRFDIWTPEGQRWKPATKEDGTPRKLVWQSYEVMENALAMLRDGSPENISRRLGRGQKIRQFFNDLNWPMNQTGRTVDTHDVVSGQLRIGRSVKPAVQDVMGGTSSPQLGLYGLHPIYRDAGFLSTAGTGLRPNQGQSVGWEGIKALLDPNQRQNEPLMKELDALWNRYRKGEMTLPDVHYAIAERASRDRGGRPIPAPWSF